MKKTSLIFLFIASVFVSNGQNISSRNQAVQMLTEFYTAYNTVWSTTKLPQLQLKLDSLQSKYCTVSLRKQLKKLAKDWGLDHDMLINDEYTDVTHLKTLNVVSEIGKPNAYIVSYIDHTLTPAYKPIDQTVVIHVTVTMENGSFKIANAYGNAINLK